MARLIDVHAHYLPPPYVEALLGRDEAPRITRRDGVLYLDFGAGGAFPVDPAMTDLALHEQGMAEFGVDHEVFAIPPPAVDWIKPADAAAIATASNDALAEMSRGHGGRFSAVAILPAADPERAAAELERAVALGLRGGALLSNVEGARLDEERFRPIFDCAATLDVPIVLHPTAPAQPEPFLGYALMTTVGFIAETTVCTLRLVLSGLFERYPEFKLLVPHIGAAIPYLVGRIAYEAERYGTDAKLSVPVAEQLSRLQLDSVSVYPPAMKLALDLVGPERFLFGTDEPFWEREKSVNALDDLGLDAGPLAAVSAGNAERLFGV